MSGIYRLFIKFLGTPDNFHKFSNLLIYWFIYSDLKRNVSNLNF